MTTEPDIGWPMLNALVAAVEARGLRVVRQSDIEPSATVSNLERVSLTEYRGDVDLAVGNLGHVCITRVYVQRVTDETGETTWLLRWPKRHREGTPRGWSQEWVTPARMTGRLRAAALSALVTAIDAEPNR